MYMEIIHAAFKSKFLLSVPKFTANPLAICSDTQEEVIERDSDILKFKHRETDRQIDRWNLEYWLTYSHISGVVTG